MNRESAAGETRFLRGLTSARKIQGFLDRTAYDPRPGTASPRRVFLEKRANCFEGALFAAAALRRLGHPPLLVDLRSVDDDDHVIAVYRRDGKWGAVAKSNVVTLCGREPVYRSLRELVMSYFDLYFNLRLVKSLREYSRPLNLSRYDDRAWMTTDEDLGEIGEDLDRLPHARLVTKAETRILAPASRALAKASFSGSVKAGLYVPRGRS